MTAKAHRDGDLDRSALPGNCHAVPTERLLQTLQVNAESGLDTPEARRRRRRYGLNRVPQKPKKHVLRILLDQMKSLILLLLSIAAITAFVMGHATEAIAIAAVIALNTIIGFVTELRAVRSMEALRTLGVVMVNVIRGGRVSPIPAQGLVPGDIVVLEAGDVVSADLRLASASRLQSNEAILTGESLPVAKQVESLPVDTLLAERTNMVYLGTAITRGSGIGVVVATGDRTELGQIAHLMEEAEASRTPLEQRIDELSRQLMWVALGFAAVIGITGVASGRDLYMMIESAIALAVATVPEGLPMVATLALARGMWRMARRQALIERLSAVETLGATTLILTDKTGTLTENRMVVTHLVLADGREVALDGAADNPALDETRHLALTCAVLCNNASLAGGDPVGDPMEVALLQMAERFGVHRESALADLPESREHAFDPDRKMMATVHELEPSRWLYLIKGAPEAVLAAVEAPEDGRNALPADWQRKADEMAASGLRVLALAGKTAASATEEPYRDLSLYALVGFSDPPRADVAEAIGRCQQAGVRVVMVTGDHAATALSIARATGLTQSDDATVVDGAMLEAATGSYPDAPIFARVTPAQKLRIIETYQERGEVVAMTGDGVNDAPALRKSDIGIAMGARGSQVARDAADMILLDDRFYTIVGAIAQGRAIFGNIRKFIIYLMSCNVSELLVVGLAAFGGAPLPLLPLQILYLNLITDVFPAFALGVGEGERDIMQRKPRPPQEPLLARRHWAEIGLGAVIITFATLTAFGLGLTWFAMPASDAVTLSFLTLALAQLWHVFNMRNTGSSWLVNEITRNRFVWAAILLCLFLILLPVYVDPAAGLLGLTPPPVEALTTAIVLSGVPLLAGQLLKSWRRPTP